MFGHGPSRTGRGPLEGPALTDQPTLLWGIKGTVNSSALFSVIGVGRVFSVTNVGQVFSVDSSTGAPLWSYSTGLTIASSPALGSAGLVYVCGYSTQSASAFLFAIDYDTGSLRWTFPLGNVTLRSSPAVGPADGTVYFGAANVFYAIDGHTGQQLWASNACDGAMDSPPALSADGALVYASSSAFTLYAFSSGTGAVVWQQNEPCPSCKAAGGLQAVGSDGTVFGVSYSGVLTAYDGANGTRKWAKPVANLGLLSIAVGVLDLVYVSYYTIAPFSVGVQAFNSATGGDPLWYNPLGNVTGLAVGADGTLFVGTMTSVGAVSGLTGETLWTLPCSNSYTQAALAIGPGKALFVPNATGIVAIGPAPSAAPIPPPPSRLVDIAGGASAGFVAALLLVAAGLAVRWYVRRTRAADPAENAALISAQSSLLEAGTGTAAAASS